MAASMHEGSLPATRFDLDRWMKTRQAAAGRYACVAKCETSSCFQSETEKTLLGNCSFWHRHSTLHALVYSRILILRNLYFRPALELKNGTSR